MPTRPLPAPPAPARGGARFSARSRFGSRRRSGAQSQVQGRWSLAAGIFGADAEDPAGAPDRRRALAELLLERYGIVTREQVLAENVRGGFAALYDTFNKLETLGVCRRGYFIEGMGGAQFALPGAVERLRARGRPRVDAGDRRHRPRPALRGRPAVAQARARAGAPGARGGRLPGARVASSRRCTWSAAGAAC